MKIVVAMVTDNRQGTYVLQTTTACSFQGAVSVISSKLSHLEPGNLGNVEVRLHSIIIISGS